MSLEKYIHKFQNLRVDRAHGIAPHKPILLLSIIEQIATNHIQSNRIEITPELVASFAEHWSVLVTSNHDKRFALPFYHLKSDGFWYLVVKTGYESILSISGQMRSFSNLNQAVDYAQFDNELFELLKNESSRKILKYILVDTYFSKVRERYMINHLPEKPYLETIENKILTESPIKYSLEYEKLEEEEIFVRSGVFKKVIPKIYNYTCCISELRVIALFDVSIVDACHIIPFKVSHDDTISNGFCLCPNLHRAFDRGLISIDEDFRVVISSRFSENSNTDYGVKKFAGKRILLPDDSMLYPLSKNFRWHRQNIFSP